MHKHPLIGIWEVDVHEVLAIPSQPFHCGEIVVHLACGRVKQVPEEVHHDGVPVAASQVHSGLLHQEAGISIPLDALVVNVSRIEPHGDERIHLHLRDLTILSEGIGVHWTNSLG